MAHDDALPEDVPETQTVADQLELHLDSTEIAPDGSVYLIKRRITSVGGLEIYVYPQDHDPPHFHVVSKQRKIDARFHLETLEVISMKRGEIRQKETRQIQDFFRTHPDALADLKVAYRQLQG